MRPSGRGGRRQIVGCNAPYRIMWQAARKRYAPSSTSIRCNSHGVYFAKVVKCHFSEVNAIEKGSLEHLGLDLWKCIIFRRLVYLFVVYLLKIKFFCKNEERGVVNLVMFLILY